MKKLSYKDKPPYKSIYSIEAAYHKRAVLMFGSIVKEIEKELSAKLK